MLLTEINPEEAIQLWQQFRAGDERALGTLARLYYPDLYDYGIRLMNDPATVKDALQDLFLELWDRRASIADVSFIKTYLFKAVRYKLSKVRRQAVFVSTDELFEWRLPPVASYEEQRVADETASEQAQQLSRLLSTLSRRQQEILFLRFHRNLDNAAIAEVMNIDRRSVANLIHRTLRQLREQWSFYSLFLLSGFGFPA